MSAILNSPILKKITLVILVIALGSVLISGFGIQYALGRHFQLYLERIEVARQQQVVKSLADLYQDNGGWPHTPDVFLVGRGNAMGTLRYVKDINGRVVMTFRRGGMPPPPDQPRREEKMTSRDIVVAAKKVGTAYFGRSPVQDILSRQDEIFRHTINQSIVWSILFTGLLSVIVAVIFARKLSDPITAINRVAKEMTAGKLESRVRTIPHDELGELGISLNQLAERLQEVETLRRKMTADVAHDLRTPLTTVRSHLEGMIDEVIPVSKASLESLLEEVNRLGTLVADLQEVALADRAIHHFTPEPVDVAEYMQILLKRKTPLYNEKGIRLEIKDGPAAILWTDRDALAKILDNLLSNAYKYTPAGKTVTIEWRIDDTTVFISVRDQGVGIAPEHLSYIFERFYRTDPSRNRESGGFGLGLTIAKELAEALGGSITVESQEGIGSTFTVQLPLSGGSHTEK